jgi:hypothetical protein
VYAPIDNRADADWPSPSSAIRGSKINNDRNIEVSRLPRPAGDPTPLQGREEEEPDERCYQIGISTCILSFPNRARAGYARSEARQLALLRLAAADVGVAPIKLLMPDGWRHAVRCATHSLVSALGRYETKGTALHRLRQEDEYRENRRFGMVAQRAGKETVRYF